MMVCPEERRLSKLGIVLGKSSRSPKQSMVMSRCSRTVTCCGFSQHAVVFLQMRADILISIPPRSVCSDIAAMLLSSADGIKISTLPLQWTNEIDAPLSDGRSASNGPLGQSSPRSFRYGASPLNRVVIEALDICQAADLMVPPAPERRRSDCHSARKKLPLRCGRCRLPALVRDGQWTPAADPVSGLTLVKKRAPLSRNTLRRFAHQARFMRHVADLASRYDFCHARGGSSGIFEHHHPPAHPEPNAPRPLGCPCSEGYLRSLRLAFLC